MSEQLDHTAIPGGRITTGLLIGLCLASLVWLPFGILEEWQLYNFIQRHPPLVYMGTSVVVFASGVPTICAMGWLLIQRWRAALTVNRLNTLLKVGVVNGVVIIATLIISHWAQSIWLHNNGYQRCSFMSNPTPYATKAWVVSDKYCLQGSSLIASDLADWVNHEFTQLSLSLIHI